MFVQKIDETKLSRIRLMSVDDREALSESKLRLEKKLQKLMMSLTETRVTSHDSSLLKREFLREARRLERLVILEGVSDKSFYELQKNFRSMVRAANVVVKWLPDSELSSKMEQLRTQGIELLNDLFEHIKNIEATGGKGMAPVGRDLAQKRDQFVKVFTDFAIMFRGVMSIADLFSEDPATVGGYNELSDIFASLEREGLTSEPLGRALAVYDHDIAGSDIDVPTRKGPARLMGKRTQSLAKKCKSVLVKAIQSKTPGFSRLVDINNVVDTLMARSVDQLTAVFTRFNGFVAADVDVDYLLSVTKNPRSVSSVFKSLWDTLSASGPMKSLH